MGGFGGGHSGGGGFHGGHSGGFHSSGGGFHGGHSSSSSHSSSGYRPHHSSSFIYVGGRRYETSGSNNNDGYKKPAVISTILIAVVVFIIGVFMFINIYCESSVATVTKVNLVSNTYDHYETYDFTYSVRGKTYTGHGDDDLKYYYSDSNYEFSVKVGEKYTIYTKLLNPSDYYYENENFGAFIVLIITVCISAAIVINTMKNLENYKKRLEAIGDLNGDGKVDEKDVAIFLKRNMESSDKKNEPQFKTCQYCESLVSINEKNCPNCGASMKY